MGLQQTLFLSVVVLFLPIAHFWQDEFCLAMGFVIGHYWLVMGFLMIGERTSMSRRVQRTLPRSIFGRSFFSLLMPGSSRGFLFAVANLWACSLLVLALCYFDWWLISSDSGSRINNLGAGRNPALMPGTLTMRALGSMVANALFVTWFLSITFLLMKWLFRKRVHDATSLSGPFVSFLVGAFLVVIMIVGPFVAHLNLVDFSTRNDGSIWLVPHWYWSVVEISDGSLIMSNASWMLSILFFAQALAVSLVAFLVASRDLLDRPIEIPERVAIETKRNPMRLAKGESIQEIFGELAPESDGR